MSDLKSEALAEFYTECEEILSRIQAELLILEGAFQESSVDSIYRDLHTLKGSAQLFGFNDLGALAHAFETAMEPSRRHRLKPKDRFLSHIEAGLDLISEWVSLMRAGASLNQLGPRIDQLVENLVSIAADNVGWELEPTPESSGALLSEENFATASNIQGATSVEKNESVNLASPASESKNEKKGTNAKVEPHLSAVQNGSKSAGSTPQPATTSGHEPEGSSESSLIRVPVSLLDRLVNLVGEVVLVRNQIRQYSQSSNDFNLLGLSQNLDVVTSKLQEEVLRTRMQPVGSVLNKFHRVVRDLARDLGKQIEFTIQGAETELDKGLLESIKDPLTHIIRNSCDHGMEAVEERKTVGKSPVGKIAVRAYQEGGQVIVEVRDDGRGLNSKKILAKALEKGLVSADQGARLSSSEIQRLIFLPGFSTAATVSSVSGRGVGMDVVKTNIERVGGSVDLSSEEGQGTEIRLRIPLTLAIVPALIVVASSELYAIPQVRIQELVRAYDDRGQLRIESLQGQSVLRLRGQLLPVLNLHQALADKKSEVQGDMSDGTIVIISGDHGLFGIVVSEVRDMVDVVVKPLSSVLKKLSFYAGATILGDGGVALILDVAGVSARIFSSSQPRQSAVKESAVVDADLARSVQKDRHELLLFSLSGHGLYSIPSTLVQRLEEFPGDAIGKVPGGRVVKYRDSILPIIDLGKILGMRELEIASNARASVVVVGKTRRFFGVLVQSIEDIVTTEGDFEPPIGDSGGILGTILVKDRVSHIVDILGILGSIAGPVEPEVKGTASTARKRSMKILLAEDTAFFVRHVAKIIEGAGHTVTVARDGEEAWTLLSASAPGDFDLVISDIEMPRLNGIELAKRIRAEAKWKELPLLALSTRFSEADVQRGRAAGFDTYLEKLKGDELITTIADLVSGGLSA